MTTYRKLALVLALLPLTALAAPSSDLAAMRQQVVALKIDHALNLNQAQAQALLPVLQAAAADLSAQRTASQAARLAALTQARDELVAGGSVSAATQQALASARQTSRSGMKQSMQSLRQQVTSIISADQLAAVHQAFESATSAAGRNGWRGTKGAGRSHGLFLRALTSDAFLTLLKARA
jgi:hypothetical protein